jgi:hypothetical protein
MCIYPHPAGDPLTYNNEAHVITQGLGQNDNTFPPGVLCDRCNSYFGTSIEPALLRHPSLAHDMQRLGVPGRDGGPREILGNWRRSPDGAVLVPMAPPQDWRERGDAQVGVLPILDPSFDQVRFRRGLHLLAFNKLALMQVTGEAPAEPLWDPRDARYDAVRSYIRAPRLHTEAWPFLERYDPPAVVGNVAVRLSSWNGVLIGRIRAYSFEFYVDLMNTGGLPAFAEAEGITPVRLIEPGVRYPASPTMEEVPANSRWWLRFYNGEMFLLSPKGEGFRLTPVGEPSYIKG